MNRITIILTLMALLTAISCTKQPQGRSEAVETPVHIEASMLTNGAAILSGAPATKDPILTTTFPERSSYGIFVCKHGTLDTPHKANSWNMRAYLFPDDDPSTPGWRYNYVGNLSTGALAEGFYESLSLTERLDDGATADLYAYAPYERNAYSSGPEAIPFTLKNTQASSIDYRYAIQNSDPAANTGLDPLEPVLNATFTFRHILALLEFKFKLRTGGSRYILRSINVSLNDPDSDGITSCKIYTSGTFNAITGTFNADCNAAESYLVYYQNIDIESATDEASAYLMLVPTQPEDDELVFHFTFYDKTLRPFYLKKSQLLHSDGITYGFQSGYKYTFYFTIDNYLYLDGIDIEDGWGSETVGPFEI